MNKTNFASFEKTIAIISAAQGDDTQEDKISAKNAVEIQKHNAASTSAKDAAQKLKDLLAQKSASAVKKIPSTTSIGVSTAIANKLKSAASASKPTMQTESKKTSNTKDNDGEWKSSTPSRTENNPVGLFCEVGSINAEEFLDNLVAFNYGMDFPAGSMPSNNLNEAISFLQSKMKDKDVNVAGMNNHNRVRALVDGFIGCNISLPLGIQLYLARDLANTQVNPDGGWEPSLTKARLNEVIVCKRDFVVLPDEFHKKASNIVGRLNSEIGHEGNFFDLAKEGNKMGAAKSLLNAIIFSSYLEALGINERYLKIDTDLVMNLATVIAGFNTSQAGLIVKTALEACSGEGLTKDLEKKFMRQMSSLGPCPDIKEEKKTFTSSLKEMLAAKGIDF